MSLKNLQPIKTDIQKRLKQNQSSSYTKDQQTGKHAQNMQLPDLASEQQYRKKT